MEVVEGRQQAKGNAIAERMSRRSTRTYEMGTALEGIRRTAKGRRDAKFTGPLYYIYAPERLRAAYHALKRDAAAGVDGQTWELYGKRTSVYRVVTCASVWQANGSGGRDCGGVIVRHEALDLTARGGSKTRQNPGQVIGRVDLQQLAGARNRVDHRRAPAGVRVPDVHPVFCAKFCRADAALNVSV